MVAVDVVDVDDDADGHEFSAGLVAVHDVSAAHDVRAIDDDDDDDDDGDDDDGDDDETDPVAVDVAVVFSDRTSVAPHATT